MTKTRVLNFCHSCFEIVSDFVLRASDFDRTNPRLVNEGYVLFCQINYGSTCRSGAADLVQLGLVPIAAIVYTPVDGQVGTTLLFR